MDMVSPEHLEQGKCGHLFEIMIGDSEMDFIDHAQIMIPAMTGLAVTVFDSDDPDFQQFERENCLSPELQPLYTTVGLQQFFDKKDGNRIYDISDTLDTRVLLMKIQERWVVLGPYVVTPWDENAAKVLLVKVGAQESMRLPYKVYRCKLPLVQHELAVHIAVLLITHTVGNEPPREIETIDMLVGSGLADRPQISQTFEELTVVNKRYELENQFMEAIAQGKTAKSLDLFREIFLLVPGLRYNSGDLTDQIAGAAILRTLVRRAAVQGGLTPILIDAISQEYAQQMHRALDDTTINDLMERHVVAICEAIRANRKNDYSAYVKRAVQYIETHLSQPISVDTLCQLNGISRNHFVHLFSKETGKTVKQYIAQARCERAAELLENSQLLVHDISNYVGYEDNNYFAKVFKSVMGVSPQEYRKEKTFY